MRFKPEDAEDDEKWVKHSNWTNDIDSRDIFVNN